MLTEHQLSDPVELSVAERDALRDVVPGLSVVPEPGSTDRYRLTCGSTVGVVQVGDVMLELRPKVGLAPLLFMLAYRASPADWRSETTLAADTTMSEALVELFARFTRNATRAGLLHSYRRQQDAATTVRGRVRMTDQMTRRRGMALPVEVEFDEFTADILENQVLRTAVDVLRRLRLRSQGSRRTVDRLHHLLHDISPLADTRRVPTPLWTRLNVHYRPAFSLAASLITGGLEARAGERFGAGLLVDMNAVFEEFVRAALREAIGASEREFPVGSAGLRRWLDVEHRVPLEPDLTWWQDGRCVFVGDCKYKRTTGSIPNADVYQMLAYLTAHDLDEGLLIYAAGEADVGDVRIAAAGKTVRVRTLDVAVRPGALLEAVAVLAQAVRLSATQAHEASPPARWAATLP
ncbi:5-methylcytosine restriction system specificity protein McrC [Kineococcus siccus]|uniref:5-methylcytosine restriction system specificity protein McrC n=1 Tax=Kineococcus siccus TaxID=2696567 RepID=UPI001412345E